MTIYTVMGTNNLIEWVAKSFIDEQAATNFLNLCSSTARRAGSIHELLEFSPDPTINTNQVKYHLRSSRINYTLHINELVTDAFMELTLQPHKPKHQFKEFL